MTDEDLLEVRPGASRDEVKASFKRLAFELHPDRGGDESAFKELVAARDRLLSGIPRPAGDKARCAKCSGTGFVTHASGFSAVRLACESCGGDGEV